MSALRMLSVRPPADATARILDVTEWCEITFLHSGGGNVAVGTNQNLLPLAGGEGFLLTATVPLKIYVPPRTTFYAAASAINQIVSIAISPLPLGLLGDQSLKLLGDPRLLGDRR